MKILIVEDELKVAESLKKGLEINEYATEIALDGKSALKLVAAEKFNAIILDINIPIINGLEVCQQIRKKDENIPILILTAFSKTAEKISGFNLGADDYMVKPFDFEELLVRLKSLLKRSEAYQNSDPILKIADLEIDLRSKITRRAGLEIKLTQKEFSLLEFLLRNKGRVLSKSAIAEKIWNVTFDTGTNVIDLYIYYLRQKIDKDFPVKLIHTVFGRGYILKEGNNED
jgi:two-component system copper resistance phosphate regulon response regulator CusR